jgi:hypothetical protein
MYTGSFTAMALLIPMVVLAGAAVAGVPPGGTFVDDDGNIHEGSIEAIADRPYCRLWAGRRSVILASERPVDEGSMVFE